ncbi:MAG: ATP-binding protein [Spirochaetaceae bacterium]
MISRVFQVYLEELLSFFPVVALVGPRQVGKSTLVRAEPFVSNRSYVTLDAVASRSVAQSDPVSVLDADGPVTIDEIQLVPSLLREIKLRVDRDRIPGRFLITGSADLNYAADLSHVLAGRVGVISLPPITEHELSETTDAPLWTRLLQEPFEPPGRSGGQGYRWERLAIGGFPLSVLARDDRERALWMDSFRTTYLERDLRRLSDISHLSEFSRLMELTAARSGALLNQASMARDVGLTPQTVGRYLSVLEASLLITRLRPWYTNIGKRVVKSPKLYWRDTGLAAHLIGLGGDQIESHPSRGALFETAVVNEIAALLPLFATGADPFHLRTHDGLEIDLIIRYQGRLIPIEIKARRTAHPEDAAPIEKWIALAGAAPGPERIADVGAVLYAGTEVVRLSRHVWGIPFS